MVHKSSYLYLFAEGEGIEPPKNQIQSLVRLPIPPPLTGALFFPRVSALRCRKLLHTIKVYGLVVSKEGG